MFRFEKEKKNWAEINILKKWIWKSKILNHHHGQYFLIFHYTVCDKKIHQIIFFPLYQKYPILFFHLFLYLFPHTRSHTHIHFFRLILLHFLILLSFLFFCLLSSFFLRHLFFLNFEKVKSYPPPLSLPLSLPLSPYLQKDEVSLTNKKIIFLYLRNLSILSEWKDFLFFWHILLVNYVFIFIFIFYVNS